MRTCPRDLSHINDVSHLSLMARFVQPEQTDEIIIFRLTFFYLEVYMVVIKDVIRLSLVALW